MFREVFLALCLISVLASAGCGGGSNSTSFSGGAESSLIVDPDEIDTGDHTRVELDLTDVHPDGVVIKFHYPPELAFVEGSAELTISDEDEIALTPDYLVTDEDGAFYLVFFLSEEDFGPEEEGIVSFELRGLDELEDGEVDVDVDIRDSDVFDVDAPEFSPEATEIVNVGS